MAAPTCTMLTLPNGPMAWPSVLGASGRAGPGSQPGSEHLGSPSLWYHTATSLCRRGPGVCTHCLQGPPRTSSLVPRCPGAASSSDGYMRQVKAPSCSATHSVSPGACPQCCPLWRGMVPCDPGPWGCAGVEGTAAGMVLAGNAACSQWGWGRPGWEWCPTGCAAPSIWALNHAGEEMQKEGEKRQQETGGMAGEEKTPSLRAAVGL